MEAADDVQLWFVTREDNDTPTTWSDQCKEVLLFEDQVVEVYQVEVDPEEGLPLVAPHVEHDDGLQQQHPGTKPDNKAMKAALRSARHTLATGIRALVSKWLAVLAISMCTTTKLLSVLTAAQEAPPFEWSDNFENYPTVCDEPDDNFKEFSEQHWT